MYKSYKFSGTLIKWIKWTFFYFLKKQFKIKNFLSTKLKKNYYLNQLGEILRKLLLIERLFKRTNYS